MTIISKYIKRIMLALALTAVPAASLVSPVRASAASQQKKSGRQSGASRSKASSKATDRKKASRHESSTQVRRQEAAVNKEIKLTQRQIEDNERAVSENLAVLDNISRDIAIQNGRILTLEHKEQALTGEIAGCEKHIAAGEERLAGLRRRYVEAVKKMRLAHRRVSPMAFIFSSKTFYQAWRRMRYLRKFSEWRSRKEGEIREQIASLDKSRQQLADGKQALQATLASQREAQSILRDKHKAQDETVARLRASGEALRSHLARKQAEANALNNRVMQLISAEQEEARRAEQRRREQAERQAALKAQREIEAAERQREAEARAEAERAAAAERKAAEAEKAAKTKAREETAKREAAKKEAERRKAEKKAAKEKKEKKKDNKQPAPKKQAPPRQTEKRKPELEKPEVRNEEKSYAQARKRRPRGKADGNTTGNMTSRPAETPAMRSASGFASLKGSLPRPVSGQFSIVSRFGRHSLANMNDVQYDNPGIDAVVAKGASAQAVYDGTVTGVYVLDGFSTVVIISHGEYYTVYGNIGAPTVKKGDKVRQGQSLGHLVSDPDEGGRTTIHFEVWKNREKQNPEAWIR